MTSQPESPQEYMTVTPETEVTHQPDPSLVKGVPGQTPSNFPQLYKQADIRACWLL